MPYVDHIAVLSSNTTPDARSSSLALSLYICILEAFQYTLNTADSAGTSAEESYLKSTE
jgi:hypothetical protein